MKKQIDYKTLQDIRDDAIASVFDDGTTISKMKPRIKSLAVEGFMKYIMDQIFGVGYDRSYDPIIRKDSLLWKQLHNVDIQEEMNNIREEFLSKFNLHKIITKKEIDEFQKIYDRAYKNKLENMVIELAESEAVEDFDSVWKTMNEETDNETS